MTRRARCSPRWIAGLFAPLVALLLACAVLVFTPASSSAQPGALGSPANRRFPQMPNTPPASPSEPGKIRLTTENGERGPVVLRPKKATLVGEVVVWNDGAGPLSVSRVAMRTDLDDPRLPPHFNARFTDGSAGGTVIAAHSSKRVAITWTPDHEPKVRQALGHVVFTSTDEVAGEVAMGFVGTLGGPLSLLTAHALTWLLVLPLAGALVALLMRLTGYQKEEALRSLILSVTGLQCLFAAVVYLTFNGALTRVDGNDGFQLVERVVLFPAWGVEYYVGVDGTSVSLVLLLAVVGFVAAVASYGVAGRDLRDLQLYYGLLSLLLAGATGVFVSVDLCLFSVSWAVMLAALVALVASASGARRPAVWLAGHGALSVAALLFAVFLIHAQSNATFLADGTRASHTFALPELMRVAWGAKHLTLFGWAWVKVVWGALFVAFAVMVPLVPLHRWFVELLAGTAERVAVPVAVVVAAVVVKTGVYGLLRVSLGVLPDGSRWAATTLLAAGVINIACGAVFALRANDLRYRVAYATVAEVGFCLVGLGAMTREGLSGCLVQMSSHGYVTAILVLMLGALHDRAKTCDLDKLGGLGGAMPLFTVALGTAMLAAAGAPGLSGFWGETIAVFGAFPGQRVLASCAAAGAVAVAAAYLLAARRIFFGASPSPGSVANHADLGPREVAAVLPLLALVLALGLCPGTFFTLVQGGVSDLNQLVNPPGPDEIV